MKTLGFETTRDDAMAVGTVIRRARFESRSGLPVSAACVVANGVRETLTALLGASVGIRLFEPSIPAPPVWRAILHDARLYRVRGSLADAAIVLRPDDAVALAAIFFGESVAAPMPVRALSAIECDVIDRMVDALIVNLDVVCGARDGRRAERVGDLNGFVTYFELLVEPAGARIGVALSRDPSPASGSTFDAIHLAPVPVCARATLELGGIDLLGVSRIVVGSLLPIPAVALSRCTLTAGGQRLAQGDCGVSNGRFALTADSRRDPT